MKELCPCCNKKLDVKYEGLECRTPTCKLYKKGEEGWVYHFGKSNWSEQKKEINLFYSDNIKLFVKRKFILVKQKVFERDNYTCAKCGEFKQENDYSIPIQAHHIIPASEEMALYLDEDNLITLCTKCHKQVHELDKRAFR